MPRACAKNVARAYVSIVKGRFTGRSIASRAPRRYLPKRKVLPPLLQTTREKLAGIVLKLAISNILI
jgi:hypothetical protein